MNAFNSLLSDFTKFSENVTNSRSEDFWPVLFGRIFTNLSTTVFMYLLIPSKYANDVLLWNKGIYGYSKSKILVMLMMAFIFYIINANALILSVICFMASDIFVKWKPINNYEDDFFDALWENNDVVEQEENDTDFGRYPKVRIIFQALSFFWIILNSVVMVWLGHNQWNLWNGIFDGEMEWKLSVLLLLTYHTFDMVQKGVFKRIVCRSSKCLLQTAAIFLVLLFDEQIWNLDAEKREKMAHVYLLIYLSLFLTSIYNILKIAVIRPHAQFNVRENEQRKVLHSGFRIILGSGYLLFSGYSTLSLSPHLLILVANLIHLLLAMFIDYYTYRHFNNLVFAINLQTLKYLTYLNTIMLKSFFLVVLAWICVFQSVTHLRVATIVIILCLILKDTWTYYENKRPLQNGIPSLQQASAEQLALNDDVCPVCYEEMDSAYVTPCNHFYHVHCLLNWLSINNNKTKTCPLCQHALYVNNQ